MARRDASITLVPMSSLPIAAPASRPWSRRRIAIAALAWGALALARVAVMAYGAWSRGELPTGAQLGASLAFNLGLALLWAALTPLVGTWVAALRGARLPAAIAGHAAAVLSAAAADATVRRAMLEILGQPAQVPWLATATYYIDLTAASYVAILVATRALAAHDALVARSRRALALRGGLARARLAFLDLQLQPHFLFNALGSVTELAHDAPSAAARMLRQLARLLRAVVGASAPEVTLHEELATLEPYLEIQRTRFADWLAFDVRTAPGSERARVPRLVLQPLVENAVEHGLRGRTAPGRITIEARADGPSLVLAIHDNGRGLRPGAGRHEGVGLTNVRARLDSLYGGAARLELRSNADGGATSELRLPLREAPEAEEPPDLSAPAPLPDEGRALRFLRDHATATVVVGWLLWGAAWMQQSLAYLALRGRLTSESFARALRWNAAGAALWAILTPLVFALAARIPLAGPRPRRSAAIHAVAAFLFATTHAALLELARSGSVSARTVDPTMLLWNVIAYCVLVALAEYRSVMQASAEHALAEARLRAELEEERFRGASLRARPAELLERLERLADDVERAPAGADEALAALAADLRRLLDEARTPRYRDQFPRPRLVAVGGPA